MPTPMDKPEYLSVALADAELRATDDEKPMLIGYASKYGNWYKVWDFEERIAAGAFDAVLRDRETDVVASMNHDVNFAFARQSAGTLRLKSNSVGLQYEADITDDDGRKVHAKVKNGTIQGSSFMFADVDDTWEFKEGAMPRRTITRVGKLYELGPVVWPANAAATVKARADEILAEARQKAQGVATPEAVLAQAKEEPKPVAISPERAKDIRYAYEEMGRIINHVKDKNGSPDA